jgi:hypothetical protein
MIRATARILALQASEHSAWAALYRKEFKRTGRELYRMMAAVHVARVEERMARKAEVTTRRAGKSG